MPEERAAKSSEPPGELQEQASILIVDDREDKRLAMETVISEIDARIVKVDSGKEALRALLNNDFAVILLDVNMPAMDGFETAFLIRQRKQSEHTPIIFVTGISDTDTHVTRGYSLGAVDYILTPVVPDVLRTKVSVFVELYKKTQQLKRQAERLRRAHDELESRVRERTAELAKVNTDLQAEIAERQRVEEKIRKINGDLEQRVMDRTVELEMANQELEAFTYSVAHDLQAPLRNIVSYSQMLEEDFGPQVPEDARQYWQRIGSRAQYMAQLVNDLLNLSRISKQSLNRQEIKLKNMAEELIAALKAENPRRQIHWEVGNLPSLSGDPNLVRLVMVNLLSNAVKYTQTRPEATIEIGETGSNGEASIFIRDNGVGFDMKYADKLFGVFQRLHPPGQFEGTGVGLATVARIIRKHGGRVWAEAEEGKGATFYFTLGSVK